MYNSDGNETMGEDLAEAVRIYLTNSDYLKTNFKSRYKFIKDNYPFIRENAIIDILSEN